MNRENIIDITKTSSNRSVKQMGEYYLTGDTKIFVTEPLPENIDINNIITFLKTRIPHKFISLVDVIYIGQFDHLKQRNVNAIFLEGALYITNEQDNEKDMIDDVIHEIAHAAEKRYQSFLYTDQKIKNEFLRKREVLRRTLKYEGYAIDPEYYQNAEYNVEFDDFLYKEIGYPKLRTLSQHIFASPYAATSLREYFADGFEDYYLGKRRNLKEISPVLYSKLEELENEESY